MSEFVEFHDEEIQNWIERTRNEFMMMTDTIQRYAHILELETQYRVPFETGRLQGSYRGTFVEKSSDFIEYEVGYDVADPKTGFRYALYQHEEDLSHPPRKSSFSSGSPVPSSYNRERFYLLNGLNASSGEFFEMVEKDYLSLFGGVL